MKRLLTKNNPSPISNSSHSPNGVLHEELDHSQNRTNRCRGIDNSHRHKLQLEVEDRGHLHASNVTPDGWLEDGDQVQVDCSPKGDKIDFMIHDDGSLTGPSFIGVLKKGK